MRRAGWDACRATTVAVVADDARAIRRHLAGNDSGRYCQLLRRWTYQTLHLFDGRQGCDDGGVQRASDLFGIANRIIKDICQDGGAYRDDGGKYESEEQVQIRFWKHRF